ncbi:MAG: hypothetical protein EAZ85_00125 [Bacteroidetes bacterium]|nr:MAG: hypothetical protein EAZ85_00125 [Bacteroidota bacterium]TAG90559.1 MAG: hypothetical protein EAZ20_04030 [Bacteroidota bacterium]
MKKYAISLGILTFILAILGYIYVILHQSNPFPPMINKNIVLKENIFEKGKKIAMLESNALTEASGLVMSRANHNFFWTHNDSGGKPEIYLFDKNGLHWATFKVPAFARDWEEIKIGAGPQANKNYIYVGDIGDNQGKYDIKKIYRFVEPNLHTISRGYRGYIPKIDSLRFRYPNNAKRDSEAFIPDPITKDIYIITKREKPKVMVFKWKYPQSTQKIEIVELIAELPCFKIVAGDISVDGQEIILKDYDNVYYWKRNEKEDLDKTFKRLPVRLPYFSEPQGEALAFSTDKSEGYFTLSESTKYKPEQFFYYYSKINK